MLRIADYAEAFVFRSSKRTLLGVVFLLTVVKSGIWYIPNMFLMRHIADSPFANTLEENSHYLFWNWLGPFSAWLIGATALWPLFLFHLVFSLAFTAAMAGLLTARLPDREARASWILFSILPVSGTAYFWVGTDSITLFLMAAALAFPRRRWVPLLLGVALGAQHFEQSLFAAAGVLLALLLSRCMRQQVEYGLAWAGMLLAGIVAGKLVLLGVFAYWQVDVRAGRVDWLRDHLDSILRHFLLHVHFCIWSVLGVGWLAVIKYGERGRPALPFFAALAPLMLLLFVSDDQTRVLAIVTFPLIAVYLLFSSEWLSSLSDRLVAWLFLLWLILPWGWVIGGRPLCSMFGYDVACVLGRLTGWWHIPSIEIPPFQ